MEDEKQDAGLPVSPSVKPGGAQGTGSRGVPFTPGPWAWANIIKEATDCSGLVAYRPGEEASITTLLVLKEGFKFAPGNARLIAAAPELYIALWELLDGWQAELCSFFGEHALPDFEEVPQVQQARRALAKVRGEDAPAIQSPTPQQESKKDAEGGKKDGR